MAEEMFHLTSL